MNTSWKTKIRSSRWFVPVLISAGIIGVLLIALLAIPVLIDINTYRDPIAGQIQQALNRPVKLGRMKLRIFPTLNVGVEDLQIGDDPQFARGEFVKARSVRLGMGLWSLLRGKPEVQGIEFIEPTIFLTRNPAGQWNWSSLKPLQEKSATSDQPPLNLAIRNGRFTLLDQSLTPAAEKTYTGVDVDLKGFSPRDSFDLSIAMTMPGEKGGKVMLEGEAGPIDKQDAMRTPVDLRLRTDGVEIDAIETLAGTPSPRAGRLTMDVKLTGKLADGLKTNGQIKAEQLRLIDNVEPARTPLEAEFVMLAKSEGQPNAPNAETAYSLAIEKAQVRMGKTQADIAGRIDRIPAQPAVDLRIKGDGVALDSLLESAYAFGFGPPAGTRASGAATIDLRAAGAAASPAVNGKIALRDLKFQNSSMPQPVTVSELRLDCTPEQISAAPFRATLSRTTVDLNNLRVTSYTQDPRAHLEISTGNAQLDDLLHIAESFGARPPISASGGTASLQAAVDTRLNSTASGMNISGSGKLTNARLQPQGAKPIDVANADLRFTGDSLRVDNLAAQTGASQINGWLQVKDFDRPVLGFDLKSNQLDMAEVQALTASSSGKQGKGGGSSAPIRGQGQIAIGRLQVNSLTATDVHTTITMENNVLRLDPLDLKLYAGAYKGAVSVDQSAGAQAPPEIALRGAFNGIDVNQFLSSGGEKSSIYGRANGSINVRGRNEASRDAMMKSLAGDGFIQVNDGKFTSFDLMKQLEVVGKLFNLPTGGAGTAFRSLKSNLVFERGRLRTDTLQIVMDDLQVNGNGVMQLGETPSIDYDILTRLSPELTRRVVSQSDSSGGGTAGKILSGLGKLTSAVGSFFVDQNVAVIPLRVSGPITQPSFGLNSNLLEKQAKARLTERIVEGFSKTQPTPTPAPGQEAAPTPTPANEQPKSKPKPADLLKDILEGFGKKKKPPQ